MHDILNVLISIRAYWSIYKGYSERMEIKLKKGVRAIFKGISYDLNFRD